MTCFDSSACPISSRTSAGSRSTVRYSACSSSQRCGFTPTRDRAPLSAYMRQSLWTHFARILYAGSSLCELPQWRGFARIRAFDALLCARRPPVSAGLCETSLHAGPHRLCQLVDRRAYLRCTRVCRRNAGPVAKDLSTGRALATLLATLDPAHAVARTRFCLMLLCWRHLSFLSATELMQTARSICSELVAHNGRHLLETVRGSSARIELTGRLNEERKSWACPGVECAC